MASFGSGFASGMGQGMAMGKMLMDTYNEYDQKDKLEKAGAIDQQEIDGGLTPEQQEQIRLTREQKLADGSNAYEVEDTKNGVRIRAAGNPDAQWGEVAGAKQYKLGDKTQSTAFTADDIARARNNAIADVYTKSGDPAKGMAFRAAAREDRKGAEMERIGDDERAFLTDIASNGGQLSEQSKEVLTKAAGIYNQNQGKHNDGRILSYDFDKGEATFTDARTGRIVDRQPINGKTATFVGGEYFNHLRGTIDPKFGLEVRNTAAGERKADASMISANADMQYKGAGGVAERLGMANIAARGEGSAKPNVRMTQVNVTDSEGVTSKVPVSVVTKMGRDGVPVVQAYTLDGKPVSDKGVMGQLAGSDDGGMSTAGRNADLTSARKRYETGNMDYSMYQQEVGRINQDYDRRDSMQRLGSDFKSVEKEQGRDAAVRSVVAQVEGAVKSPKDKDVVYGQLGIKANEVLNAKRDKKGGADLSGASSYSPQSSWRPGQNRKQLPDNMRGE